ncbi:MAG: MgtC/SapB family protein [Myxococcales bacterium]|nr:MgtC/SapB family protein [Myxococcales bacterium]
MQFVPTDSEFWVAQGIALVCGGLVGLERQLRGKPAGMRTSMLICAGTCLFVRIGAQLGAGIGSNTDAARVVGQVVTGVGFLGAGVILTRDGLVKGMTSAAVVWILAAIGSLIGVGRGGEALAATGVTLAVLVGVNRLERAYRSLRTGVHADDSMEEPMSGLPPPVQPRKP